jgi:hypothetical protein
MKISTGTGNPYIVSGMRPSAVTSAGSGRLRALAWLTAMALAGMLSACAIDAPGSSRSPSTGVGDQQPQGTCEHDLCEAGAALDPACDTCVAAVCAADDFCCTVEWDSVCVGQADELCADVDCGITGCEHDLCEVGTPLDPTCDPCVDAVCLANPGCCEGEWGAACVAAAAQICGIDCVPGGSCEHPLCEAGTPLDPTCDPCVAEVCGADGFCCEVEWDAVCVDLGEQLCGIDCDGGGNCEHELCDIGGPLDPTCDPCVTDVCNIDAFCCEVEWDQLCIDLAVDTCGIDCGGGGNCEHDLCEVGTPLDPACDTCVADVCNIDAFCCEVEWDQLCIDLAVATCGIDCGGGNCEHDLCEVGTPLDPACDTCVTDVCNIDSFCCEVEWDQLCIDLAVATCGIDCGGGTCEHDLCDVGGPLDPACDPCAGAVCDFDSFCCETEWDSVCVGEAEEICGLDCGAPIECGNGSCEVGEHCLSCPEDCGECPVCPHDVCEEGSALPFGCDTCTPNVCKVDSFCCEVAWDSVCVALVPQHCARPCE